MLLELLLGTPAGLLTLFAIAFMVLMGAWLAWMFIRKSREAGAGDDPGQPPSGAPGA